MYKVLECQNLLNKKLKIFHLNIAEHAGTEEEMQKLEHVLIFWETMHLEIEVAARKFRMQVKENKGKTFCN